MVSLQPGMSIDILFVSGCAENQVKFYPQFDHTFVKKWATDEREWEINTEAMLVDMGGALNRGRFRNAPISSSRPQGNWQWSTITTQLQGKILALEGICKGTVTN